MKAKRRRAGASGILDRDVAADPIGSDVTNGLPARDQLGSVANGHAIQHRAKGRRESKIETGPVAMSRDP